MTLKRAILRGLLGFPLGVFIGYTITVAISLCNGDGNYYSVAPELLNKTPNLISAVCLQYLFSGIIGFAFSAGSAVFEAENWSITKQTVVHFIISILTMFPAAYILHWMDHTIAGVTVYVSIFIAVYAAIWIIQIVTWKQKIKNINRKLESN